MRSKVDPLLTQEVSSRFVAMVEAHLQLSWAEVSTLMGYANRTTLDAVRAARAIPGPDKLYILARHVTPEGMRVNIDWLFTGDGAPLITVRRHNRARQTESLETELEALPGECQEALVNLVRSISRSTQKI